MNCIIEAERVISTELGRGHTNQLESANSALIRLRKKSWNIQRVHYHTSTNLGLLESNLHSIQYHWLPELYAEFGLPEVKNRAREARHQKRQTTEYKKKASESKHRHRVVEQQERQEFGKAKKQSHTYKSNIDYSVVPQISEISKAKKACLCGSTNHVRITHKSCPLNPRHTASTSEKASSSQSHETDEEESEFEGFESDGSSYEGLFSDNADSSDDEVVICNCGRAHKRDCLLNPRNKKGNASKPHVWQSRKGQSSSHFVLLQKGRAKLLLLIFVLLEKKRAKLLLQPNGLEHLHPLVPFVPL